MIFILASVVFLLSILLLYIKLFKNSTNYEKILKNSKIPIVQEPADGSSVIWPLEDFKRFKEHGNVYWVVKPDKKSKPELHVCDPQLIRRISIKDFNHFVNHTTQIPQEMFDYREILDFLNDEKWKLVRNLLSPVFTSGKLRAMYPIMTSSAEKFINFIKSQNDQNLTKINVRKHIGSFLIDMTASSTLKIDIGNPYDPSNKFVKDFKSGSGDFDPEEMQEWTLGDQEYFGKKNFWQNTYAKITHSLYCNFPSLLDYLPGLTSQTEYSEINNFFKDLIQTRKKSGEKLNDWLDILVEFESKLGSREYKKLGITESTLISQAGVFFFGGYDSLATLSSFLSFELAKNQDIQTKLWKEIKDHKESKADGKSLLDLKYLDSCILEILRVYPPIIRLGRECNIPWTCGTEKNIKLPKGTMVIFPAWPANRHCEIRPDNPDKFDPDELLKNPEMKSKITSFGHGPRICIGNRFALDGLKVFFYNIIEQFRIELIDGTENEDLISKILPGNNITISHEPIYLKFTQRK